MRKKEKKLQLVLISIGIVLVSLTYFYYPYVNKAREAKIDQNMKKNLEDKLIDGQTSAFEKVVYEGLYDLNKPFSVKSEKAYMLDSEPDIVYMSQMHVTLNLTDGRIINITSDKGRYNKNNHDCFFEKNVRVVDKETKIFSENLELLASKNFAKVYNNVRLNDPTGSLNADQIDYNFETKKFKVSMFDEKLVKMKVIK